MKQHILSSAGRAVVAGRLLSTEAFMCDQSFERMVKDETMMTLSLDGWSNCRMQSLYAFAVITKGRVTYLMGLQNLSDEMHTATYLAGRIPS